MAFSQNRIVCTALTLCLSLFAFQSHYCEAHSRETDARPHEYQVTMSILYAHGDSQQVGVRARALLKYQTDSTASSGNGVSLAVIPTMLQYQDPAYRLNINSFDDAGRGAALAKIVRQGAQLRGDHKVATSQSQARFKAQDEWDAYLAKQGKEAARALAPLKSLFALNPLIPQTQWQAKAPSVGDTLKLGNLFLIAASESTPWQITAIEGQWVTATLEQSRVQQGIENRRYGLLRFDSHTGWLDRLLLVEQQEKGDRKQTRRWLLAPKSTLYVSDMLWQDEGSTIDDSGFPLEPEDDLFEIPTLSMTPDDPDASLPMMEPDQGIMSAGWGGDDIELRYIHGLVAGDFATSVEYQNIQLIDWRDREIDLPLWRHSVRGASALEGVVSSGVNLLPLGWGESRAKLEELYQIRAEVNFTPVRTYTEQVSWQALLKQSYRFGEATLTLSALNKPNRYRLTVTNRGVNSLSPDFNGLNGKLGFEAPVGQGPKWLTSTEQLLLDELFFRELASREQASGEQASREQTSHVYILQLAEVPKSLSILHGEQLRDRVRTKAITFVTQSEYEANLANPPLTPASRGSFSGDASAKAKDRWQFAEPSVVSRTGNDLYIPMPTALAEVCRPQIDKGFNEAGKSVQWRLIDNGRGQSAYVLASQDGSRRYFYDKSIQGSIVCQGRPQWQSIGQGDKRRPWLVDLTPWLSNLDKRKAQVSRLYRSLLITDAEGRPLSPRLPKNVEELEKALVEGRFLSVDGAASSAAYLSIGDEPLSFPYQFKLKPLP
ncbi:hypothetical protein SHLO109777_04355 [Shewanella loihica]|uniref:Uncharacterized protein n=1 Tax=Shewanella loihica (strain ATCC BAA-1088 / PV-4) TaxID=323850 RepID=A3QFT1_SHELP|nr:hypothetical protein [Shewanella loihica]ABO24329.1 conserved hypothetical protein [Shewanella loihica PV-4]